MSDYPPDPANQDVVDLLDDQEDIIEEERDNELEYDSLEEDELSERELEESEMEIHSDSKYEDEMEIVDENEMDVSPNEESVDVNAEMKDDTEHLTRLEPTKTHDTSLAVTSEIENPMEVETHEIAETPVQPVAVNETLKVAKLVTIDNNETVTPKIEITSREIAKDTSQEKTNSPIVISNPQPPASSKIASPVKEQYTKETTLQSPVEKALARTPSPSFNPSEKNSRESVVVQNIKANTNRSTPKTWANFTALAGISKMNILSLTNLAESNPILSEFLDKLANVFDSADDTIPTLKAKLHKLKAENTVLETNLDQQAHDFERRVLDITAELDASKQQNSKQHQLLTAQSKQIDSLKAELSTKEANLQKIMVLDEASKTSKVAYEEEKKSFSNALLKKQEELLALNEELEYSRNQINELRGELRKVNAKMTEVQASEMESRSLYLSSEQELKQSKKMIEWCNQELEKKNEQFNEYRREKSQHVLKLQSDYENLSQEHLLAESKIQSLQTRGEELENKIQTLMEKNREYETRQILSEQQFKNEMMSQKKLTDLYQKKSQSLEDQCVDMEKLVRELELNLFNLKEQNESASAEMDRRYQDLKKYSDDQNLEIDRLRSELDVINTTIANNGKTGQLSELSETAAAASRLQKSGKTFTQVYSEYTKLQAELLKEKTETARLTECLNHIVSEIEQRGPIIQQTRVDYENAKKENDRLQTELAVALNSRNEAMTAVSGLKSQIEELTNDKLFLEKDVKDMSRQIHALLRQLEQVAPSRMQHLEREILSKLSDNIDEGVGVDAHESRAEALIAERLVVFRNIEELQSQNQALRRSLRSLSAKLDALEKSHVEEQEEKHARDLLEATKVIEGLQEQLRLQNLNMETFVRERDQWRRIAEGRVVRSNSPSKTADETLVKAQDTNSTSEYENMYRELQREFDIYRRECGHDTQLLKKDLSQVNQEKMDLSIQVAKLNNQINYMNERYDLLLKNNQDQQKETESLRQRIGNLAPLTAKQDARIEELSNTLQETRHSLEKLRSENHQMKIEREVWKASESRALKESQDLLRERNTIGERFRDLQSQLEEKERHNVNQIQKMEQKMEQLNNELQLSRKQLSDVMDDHRTLAAKREAELRESQIKIERLTSDSEKAKGELSTLKAKEEMLQTRVQELTSRLASADEKLSFFEGRKFNLERLGNTNPTNDRSDLELALAQTRIDLEAAKAELKLQTEQAEQFKSISQASEERLMEMNSTYDLYKSEVEGKITELESKVTSLERECSNLKENLERAVHEVTESQEKIDALNNEIESERRSFEKQIANLKSNEQLAIKAQAEMKVDLNRQVSLFNDAQASYEREVVAHSLALQTISTLKQTQEDLAKKLKESELASQVNLDALETQKRSFEAIKEKLSEQNSELERRVEDLVSQNNLLHSQFEQLSSMPKISADSIDDETANAPQPLKDLQDVIKFLRREKDIVDTKLQLSIHENERSQLLNQHLQKSLDETRLLLDEERKRNDTSAESEKKHQELLERIEQANLLRESNVTLRAQLEQTQIKLNQVEKRFSQAQMEIEPLKEQVVELQAEIEARKAEARALAEDNERWKGRTQKILQKYERIDPVEHKKLKEDVAELTAEKERLIAELKEKLEEYEKSKEEINGRLKKINEVAKKYKTLSTERLVAVSQKDALLAEKEQELTKLRESSTAQVGLAGQFAELRQEKDKLVASKEQQTIKFQAVMAKNKERIQNLEQQILTLKSTGGAISQEEKQKLQIEHQKELEQVRKDTEMKITQVMQAKLNLIQSQLAKTRSENAKLLESNATKTAEISPAAGSDTSNTSKRIREAENLTQATVEKPPSPKRLRFEHENQEAAKETEDAAKDEEEPLEDEDDVEDEEEEQPDEMEEDLEETINDQAEAEFEAQLESDEAQLEMEDVEAESEKEMENDGAAADIPIISEPEVAEHEIVETATEDEKKESEIPAPISEAPKAISPIIAPTEEPKKTSPLLEFAEDAKVASPELKKVQIINQPKSNDEDKNISKPATEEQKKISPILPPGEGSITQPPVTSIVQETKDTTKVAIQRTPTSKKITPIVFDTTQAQASAAPPAQADPAAAARQLKTDLLKQKMLKEKMKKTESGRGSKIIKVMRNITKAQSEEQAGAEKGISIAGRGRGRGAKSARGRGRGASE